MMLLMEVFRFLAPIVDLYIGNSRENTSAWVKLRTACKELDQVIVIKFVVDYNNNILWELNLRPRYCHGVNGHRIPFSFDPSPYLIWSRAHFRKVEDRTYARPTGAPPVVRLRAGDPIPKSKPSKSAAKKVHLQVYSSLNIFELDINTSCTVNELKIQIQGTLNVDASRITAYWHSPDKLIELLDLRQLLDYRMEDHEELTLHISQQMWEDDDCNQVREKTEMMMILENADKGPMQKKAAELRKILDELTEDEDKEKLIALHDKYEESRLQFQKSQREALQDLQRWRDFDKECAKKCGRQWGPFGFGGSSSSSKR
jgi:hypothetical protein